MEKDIHRKCIASGEIKPKTNMLRFVLVNGNTVVPDFYKKLEGKGIYVSNSKRLLETAVNKHLFAKVTKGKAHVEDALVPMVETLLKKKCFDMLNFARKAGQFVAGFEKVKDAVIKNKAAFLLEAVDAGEDGHQKILAVAGSLEVLALFNVEELDKALDKVNTVHAALLKGDMANAVYRELKRYEQFLNA